MPPRRSIGADRVQGGVSTAPPHVSMRNPSRTPLAFSGVDMMPVFSATKDRRRSSVKRLDLDSNNVLTPMPPIEDGQRWVREANIDSIIGPLRLGDGSVTERGTSSTRSRHPSPRRRRARTKSTQEDAARMLFANLPATSDWFQWPAQKQTAKADTTHSHRLPDLHPSLVRKEPKPKQRSIANNLVPQQLTRPAASTTAPTNDSPVSHASKPQDPPSPVVTQRPPHSHRKLVDATAAAPSSTDVLEAAMAASTTTTDSQTQTEHTPKPPPARHARNAIGGWNMFQSQLQASAVKGGSQQAPIVVAPEPVKKSGWALVAKAKEPTVDKPNPLLIEALDRLGADLSHLHGHALPDLLEQAVIPRSCRTQIATAALAMNPYASNIHAAEQASQLVHQKVMYAMDRLDTTKLNPGNKIAPRLFADSLMELSANRPYFLSPRHGSGFGWGQGRRLGQLQRRGGRRGRGDGGGPTGWMIDSSIFARRRLEAEGKQYFDTPDIFKKRCQVDWHNATLKKRFLMVMARNDDDGFAGLKEELKEVEDEFGSIYPMIVRVFDYYCCKSNALDESVFAMSLGGWRFMVRDFALATHKSKYCKPADCDNIFIATNYEEDPDSELGQTNDDLALMRFELLEALTRVSILKFGKDLGIFDISDSVNGLLHTDLAPGLAKNPLLESLAIDRNVFKRRLYTKACAEVLEGKEAVLKAMYCFFKGKERKRTMQMPGWIRCCELLGWTGRDRDGGLSYQQAKLAYLCSQMCCTDEVKMHARCVSLSWVEFLEAIARVAEFMQPPTAEEEAVWMQESVDTDWDEMNQTVSTVRWEQLNAHAGEEEVPLHVKLQSVLDAAVATLHSKWFTTTPDTLVKKLNTLTNAMGSSSAPY